MLLAAGVPLPRQVFVHGFIYAKGERLSKSLGNVVDPGELAERVGSDALRFYLIDAIPTGRDGEFTIEQLVEHCNTHLANKLGNLASRTVTLVHKYFEGRTPADWSPESFADPAARAGFDAVIAAAATAAAEVPRAWEEIRLHEALDSAWTMIERANEFVDRAKPWESGKDPARRAELGTTLSALLETLRLAAIWGWPAFPAKAEQLWKTLGLPGSPGEVRGEAATPRFGPIEPPAIGASAILFPRIQLQDAASAPKAG